MPSRVVALAVAVGIAVAAPAAASASASASRTVDADPLTLATPKRAPGQFELLTRSTLPDLVTGGDVLVELRGLRGGDRVVSVRAGRRVVTAAFAPVSPGVRRGLVTDLGRGATELRAVVRGGGRGRREARLRVRNHPITGPVLSGPQQTPFYCQTEASGLGAPLDADCSVRTTFSWYYRSAADQSFHALPDPSAPYPADVARVTTSKGRTVPLVVRVETATINRGIARIAVLDDPAARGARPFRAAEWNRRVTYAFGESCGVGYRQGVSTPQDVLGGVPDRIDTSNILSTIYGLTERLAAGDVVAHSTHTSFGVNCNALLSGETLAMMKEHIAETYGVPERTVGVGASGGALQQYNAANTFPGLIDAATPMATFTDVISTAMTVVDCGLLTHYWASAAGWTDAQKEAVAGQRTTSICVDWGRLFLPLLRPSEGCDGIVPQSVRYDPATNPKGVRCTLQDGLRNLVGVDAKTGFAHRPYDNAGVQYGLRAFNAGTITVGQFLDLNRRIGGFDIDAQPQPARSTMPAFLARRAYRYGMVVGRGALDRIPVIDLATYLDLVPAADIHDDIRPFQQRARLGARAGTMQIWRGVSLPDDAQPAITSWLDRIRERGAAGDPAAIAAARPAAADDRCIVSAAGIANGLLARFNAPLGIAGLPGGPVTGAVTVGTNLPERQAPRGDGVCQRVFTAYADPRMVAGGPLSDDVIKCARKPVDPGDYAVRPTAAQLDELRAIFPSGVCDYSRPGIGEVAHSVPWPSVGGTRLATPHGLHWRVGRSARTG